MRIKLNQLAAVQMGYSFRSRIEASAGGRIAVIQMKDLLSDNTVSCNDLVRVDMEAVKEHHLVRKGDLVFRSRGTVTTAAIIIEDPGEALVAAPLLRIRVTKTEQILPEYLNWYISQRDAQIFLTSRSKSSVQKMISKQSVGDLEIVFPNLEKQRRIVELANLSAREQSLFHTLADKRGQYVDAVLMRIAKGEAE